MNSHVGFLCMELTRVSTIPSTRLPDRPTSEVYRWTLKILRWTGYGTNHHIGNWRTSGNDSGWELQGSKQRLSKRIKQGTPTTPIETSSDSGPLGIVDLVQGYCKKFRAPVDLATWATAGVTCGFWKSRKKINLYIDPLRISRWTWMDHSLLRKNGAFTFV